MKKGKKIINTLKYLPIVALPLLAQEVKGQQQGFPPSVINPFLSPDTTETAKIYNANNRLSLADIAARNSIVDARTKSSRVHTIPPNDNPLFNCNNWAKLKIVNSYDWGENVYDFEWGNLLYNGYKGFVFSEIYANGGTLADAGKDGLPMFLVNITDPVTRPEGHAMNLVFTGNNILKQLDRNIIEPRDGLTQVKPGELNIPLNCEKFIISYPYVAKSSLHEKDFGFLRILEFKIVNGEMILTYNINDDPNFNKSVGVITERENDKPVLNVASSSNPNKIKANATDANLEYIVYSVDGGAFKPLTSGVEADLGLTQGTHTIKVSARDYFRLVTDTIFTRIITAPTNYAPTITFIEPLNGKLYDKDIRLKGTIRDAENDPITASYKLDGSAPITIGKDFDTPLSLADGTHKIVIYASDPTHNVKDSTIFEFKKATAIEDPPTLEEKTKIYPNPAQDILHIKYKSGMLKNAYRTIYTLEGKLVERKTIGNMTEEDLDVIKYNRGLYMMIITDGTEREEVIIIIE